MKHLSDHSSSSEFFGAGCGGVVGVTEARVTLIRPGDMRNETARSSPTARRAPLMTPVSRPVH